MTSRLGMKLRNPLFLLWLAAGLLAFVVQSGELGTADTTHRLQTAHWLWTSQPQVFPSEYPEFDLPGTGGRIFSWFGIGQSLLMLPADLLATWIAHFRIFSGYEDDPAVRSIVVSYSTNILVNVLTALIAFRLLRQLRFGANEAVAGVLTLLFCTTHLHYTQNMQENNYIMLLTLTGFSFQYEWLRSGSPRALLIGSTALGLNLLTRVTTGLDLIASGVFPLTVLWFEQVRGRALWSRLLVYCKIAAPVYFFFCDRRTSVQLLSLRIADANLSSDRRARIAPARSHAAPKLSLEYALSPRRFGRALQAREIDLSVRSCPRGRSRASCTFVETPGSGNPRLCGDVTLPAAWLYLLLRALHLLGGRLLLGRPLRFDRGRNGGTLGRAAAFALSRESKPVDLAQQHRPHRR